MTPEAEDFNGESLALHPLLSGAQNLVFDQQTHFKDWTINCVLQHLHFWNRMAYFSLMEETKFVDIMAQLRDSRLGMRDFEQQYLEKLSGPALLAAWHNFLLTLTDHFAAADPKTHVKRGGPDMSARSSITARLMETWAHGQEIYNHLGVQRINGDRIKNIACLGVNTYGWTYAVRGKKALNERLYVRLTAPSGALWEWNAPNDNNYVSGDAEQFCQVVTQTRNIGDTDLTAVGYIAIEWMSIAQCFAGGEQAPPAPGTRFTI